MRFKEKMASRKFWMALALVISSALALIIPAILNVVLGTSLTLMTGAEYVSLCTVVYGIYAGSNVYEKQVIKKLAGNEKTED